MLDLPPRLRAIVAQEYPRFSDAEYSRRHRALQAVMEAATVDHLLVVTDHRTGNAPQWVIGWPGTVEAYVVFKPGETMTMHVEWFNHFPLAKKLARGCDVRWGEHRGMALTIAELKKRGAMRVGLMGPLLARKQRELEREFTVVELDAQYVRLRLLKSEEELDWLRIGAAFSDAGFASLLAGTRPGMTERELGNLVERAYVGEGGTTFIHFIGVTSMANPALFVPPQFHSSRKVQVGDVVFCELSGSFWDYSGQVLRSFARKVLDVEPRASGGPISILESGNTVVRAFIEAGSAEILTYSSHSRIVMIATQARARVLRIHNHCPEFVHAKDCTTLADSVLYEEHWPL